MANSKKEAALSPRAKKLWARVKRGDWYKAYDERTPKAMQELLDAGLVAVRARPAVIVACYVPKARALFKPYAEERFGGEV